MGLALQSHVYVSRHTVETQSLNRNSSFEQSMFVWIKYSHYGTCNRLVPVRISEIKNQQNVILMVWLIFEV